MTFRAQATATPSKLTKKELRASGAVIEVSRHKAVLTPLFGDGSTGESLEIEGEFWRLSRQQITILISEWARAYGLQMA